MKEEDPFVIEAFPSSRQLTFDVGRISRSKHHVFALLEIDVTEPMNRLRDFKKHNDSHGGSFTVWFIKCLADAISEHRQIHALRAGRGRLVSFDDVDVSVLVEKSVDGKMVPLPVLIRNVNRKTRQEVEAELSKAKEQIVSDEGGYVLGEKQSRWGMRLFTSLPQWLRLLLWKVMLRDPFRQKQMMGTVAVTSLGMTGCHGWIVPTSIMPLCIALGSIAKKAGVHLGQIAIREYLPVTVVIDHDVIDGAPAARFVSRLVELVENGHLLV